MAQRQAFMGASGQALRGATGGNFMPPVSSFRLAGNVTFFEGTFVGTFHVTPLQ